MRTLTLTMALLTILVGSAFGKLTESERSNWWRWKTYPIKNIVLDENPNLKTHMLIYNEDGAYHFIIISAEMVIIEGTWCSNNSVENPESVIKKYKGLYDELGNGWTVVRGPENLNDGGTYTMWARGEDATVAIIAQGGKYNSMIWCFGSLVMVVDDGVLWKKVNQKVDEFYAEANHNKALP